MDVELTTNGRFSIVVVSAGTSLVLRRSSLRSRTRSTVGRKIRPFASSRASALLALVAGFERVVNVSLTHGQVLLCYYSSPGKAEIARSWVGIRLADQEKIDFIYKIAFINLCQITADGLTIKSPGITVPAPTWHRPVCAPPFRHTRRCRSDPVSAACVRGCP